MKKIVSLLLVNLLLIHHVILLSYPVSERVNELTAHYQLHVQNNPALSILEWINMHFSPVSKHLFSDVNHPQSQAVEKNFSLYTTRVANIYFHFFETTSAKKNIFEAAGKYKYLFIKEFLIPPKC